MKFQAPKSPNGDANRYCGPAVISAVTGLTTGEAARLIRSKTGRACVMGTHPSELASAFSACGISMSALKVYRDAKDAPTFAQWVKQPRIADQVYLIVYSNHWALVRNRRYVCGLTKDVAPFDHPKIKRRARVTEVYRLLLKQSGLVKPAAALKPVRKADPEAKARRAFKAFAAQHDIDWELPYRGACCPVVWGIHGADFSDNDPYEGDHESNGWVDGLDRAQTYVNLAMKVAA